MIIRSSQFSDHEKQMDKLKELQEKKQVKIMDNKLKALFDKALADPNYRKSHSIELSKN